MNPRSRGQHPVAPDYCPQSMLAAEIDLLT
jgi:hypothetical protein